MNSNLDFMYNWNNKLDCTYFTTLRLESNKYQVGSIFKVNLKTVYKKSVEVVEIKKIKLEQINDFIAALDTGYSRTKCIELIQTMYKNKGIKWDTQIMYLILCKTIKLKT